MPSFFKTRLEGQEPSLAETFHDTFMESAEGARLRQDYHGAVAELWKLHRVWLEDRTNAFVREQLAGAKDRVQAANEAFCQFKRSILEAYGRRTGTRCQILAAFPTDLILGTSLYEKTVEERLERIGPDYRDTVRLDAWRNDRLVSVFVDIQGDNDAFPGDVFIDGTLQPFFERAPSLYTILRILEEGRLGA